MPTDEQIKEYAEKLPAIYRDVLTAFPGVAPARRAGDGLTEEAIEDYVLKVGSGHRIEDAWQAVQKLLDRGFLSKSEIGEVRPTEIGERLVTAVTGHQPTAPGIPDLPVPTWG